MGRRSLVLAFIFILSFFGLGLHLYRLQVKLGVNVLAQQNRNFLDNVLRGPIFFTDKNNTKVLAAINKEYPLVYVVPKEVGDVVYFSSKMSQVTGKSEAEISKLLNNRESLYASLVWKPTEVQLQAIRDLNLKGLYIKNQMARFYPFGDLAASLLGFIGFSEKDNELLGRYGVEKFYEGKLMQAEDNEINLTIDRNIQAQAREILEDLLKTYKSSQGAIIVQEPKSGKILAMENRPSFDPNNYGDSDLKTFLNPAVQAQYEPGSVIKIITMAIGLSTGKITPETTYVDRGEITLDGKTIKNWDHKAYGRVSLSNIIEKSINTGAVFVENKIGHKDFYKGLRKFGFGEISGVDLLGELRGSLNNLERKAASDLDYATASFGQGMALTPLQLINAVSVIANHGLLMRPYVREDLGEKLIRQVISKEVARAITDMMVSAVDKAELAAIPNYSVAGKTGTAQIPDFVRGGYSDKFIHTYVGFAPAYDAKFAVLIKLDNPQGAAVAAQTVVPAFRQMSQFLLNYYNIPPDRLP